MDMNKVYAKERFDSDARGIARVLELIRKYNKSFEALNAQLEVSMTDGGYSGSMLVNLECHSHQNAHIEQLSIWYYKPSGGLRKENEKLKHERKMDEEIHQAFKNLLVKAAEDFATDEMMPDEPVESTDDFPF